MPAPTLVRILERSTEFEATLIAEFPERSFLRGAAEPRHALAAAAALLAVEHAGALRAAAVAGALNSAAALLRLQFEAVLRSAWLLFAATPAQVDKLEKVLDLDAEQAAKRSAGYMEMLIAVEKCAPAGLAAPLSEFNRYSRHALNSYVHTGIHPLARVRAGFPVDLNRPVF